MKKLYFKQLFTTLFALLSCAIVCAHDFEVDGIYYKISVTEVSVTYKGTYYDFFTNEYSGDIVIPEKVAYNGKTYSVTSIGESAFCYCSGLTSITIPNSVTSIGESAFKGCTGLTSIEIPNSVTGIGNNAFSSCSGFTSIVIPNSVTSFGNYAFSSCSGLTSVTIGNSVTSIGNYAFYACSGLTSVTIPNSVTSIGSYAFTGCSGLKEIHINDIVAWCNIDFASYDSNPLYYVKNLYLNGELVKELVIPEGVEKIKKYTFYKCSNLTSVTIPNSVTSIGNSAFYGCTSIKDICIEDGETALSLGYNNYSSEGLFYDCPLETLYLGRNINYNSSDSYGYSPFYNKKELKSVTIGNSVTSIGNSAFRNCSGLTSVTIPNNVTSIGSYAFYGCSNLKSVINYSFLTISKCSSSNGYVGYYATKVINAPKGSIEGDFVFSKPNGVNTLIEYLGNDTELTLPANYKGENYVIGEKVFMGCGEIKSVAIPSSVTGIEDSAFSGCSGLISVTIPNSVTNIGESAFFNCSGLTSVTIPNSVTSIGNSAFYGCSGLISVTIGNSVTSIGSYAFYKCSSLTSVTIGNSVTSIGNSAFYGCSSLASITIPDSVTSIGNSAFYGCSGLISVTIPNSVTSIGSDAFYKCSGLTTIELNCPIIYSWFSGLTSIQEVVIGDSVTSIGEEAFKGCTGLTSIEIPNNVISIGNSAFYGCSSLASITIPNSVTSIGSDAFYDCSNLKSVINYSFLTISKRSSSNGYVGYYATKVINAPNGTIEGDFAFAKIDGVNTLCGYIGNDTELTLPANYKGENYVIGNSAFNGCSSLTSIEIPNSVISIGNYAFSSCSGLTSVTIGNSVTSIGERAFNDCTSLKDLCIEDGETALSLGCNNCSYNDIGEGLFYDCPLETLYLGRNINYNSSDSYGYSPFYNKKELKSVTIGNSVTSIGNSAFRNCSGLTSVTIPNNVTSIGEEAFKGCTGLTSIEIPSSVTSIGEYAFYGCKGIKEVHISDLAAWCNIDFGDIYSNPLYYANNLYLNGDLVTELMIPEEVEKIKNYAFKGCTGLTSIEIPNNVISIGNSAFYGCSSLASITIPNSVTSIGSDAFYGCSSLASITIPNSVTSIGSDAFYGCSNLKSVINYSFLTISKRSSSNGYVGYYATKVINAPNGTIEGDFAFAKIDGVNTLCGYIGNDTELTLPANYKGENYVIGNSAFNGCSSLTSIEIPNSVKSIGNSAFNGCSDLTIILNCKRVGNFFGSNTSISEIVLGSNVIGILDNAFGSCSGIKSIKCTSAQPPKVGSGNFTSSHYQNVVLYVPKGSLATYQAADVWNEFWEIEEFETTDIYEVVEDETPTFEFTAGGIQLTGAEGKVVAVYTTNGALVEKIDSYAGEEIMLDKGVYIIRVGGKAVKVKL